jgi:hypothetical protein
LIDEGLPDDWPVAVIEAASKFQQGDFIDDPPVGYAANLAEPVWDLTRAETDAGGDGTVHLSIAAGSGFPLGIITSQTCDVAEDRAKAVQPWFQIAPVYQCENTARVLNSDYGYCLPKTFRPCKDKRWVADLRIEYPLEKSVLVGREPYSAFDTEAQRIAFGEELGNRRARAALADSIHTFVSETLHERRRLGRTGPIERNTVQLRLEIAGDRLDPREVRLHIITQGPLEEATQAWYDNWWSDAQAVAGEHRVALLKNRYHLDTQVNLRELPNVVLRSPFK